MPGRIARRRSSTIVLGEKQENYSSNVLKIRRGKKKFLSAWLLASSTNAACQLVMQSVSQSFPHIRYTYKHVCCYEMVEDTLYPNSGRRRIFYDAFVGVQRLLDRRGKVSGK